MKNKFNSIDEYIVAFPENVQRILIELRNTIKAVAPKAGEKISYDIPTFTLNGKSLIYFAGWKHHISVYPIPKGNDVFNERVSKYVAGKGTLKFPIDKPLPWELIREVVQLRMVENQPNAEASPGT